MAAVFGIRFRPWSSESCRSTWSTMTTPCLPRSCVCARISPKLPVFLKEFRESILLLQQQFECYVFVDPEPRFPVRRSSDSIASQVVLDNLDCVLLCHGRSQ